MKVSQHWRIVCNGWWIVWHSEDQRKLSGDYFLSACDGWGIKVMFITTACYIASKIHDIKTNRTIFFNESNEKFWGNANSDIDLWTNPQGQDKKGNNWRVGGWWGLCEGPDRFCISIFMRGGDKCGRVLVWSSSTAVLHILEMKVMASLSLALSAHHFYGASRGVL